MSFEKVKAYLAPFGLSDRCIDLKESSATVALAAEALGTEEARIAKTMSFLVDDAPLIVVVAGDARVDNHKYKETFHKKAKMIPGADCERYIGHRPGGVCPFALPDDVYVLSKEGHSAVGRRRRKTWTLGDPVSVYLARVDTTRRLVDFFIPADEPSRTASGRKRK